MAKKSRQTMPRDHVAVESEEPIRRFPDFDLEELVERRTALTNSVIVIQQLLELLSQNPHDNIFGVHPTRLPLFLAHLTITYDTLKQAAHYYHQDIETARRTETLSIVTAPTGLVGPDGRPL